MVEDAIANIALHPTIVLSLPSISKNGRHHNIVYCHNYCASPLNKPLLYHPLSAVQRQLLIAYQYNFNNTAAKAVPLYEVMALTQATWNFKAYELNYNSCNKRRKQL